MSVNWTRHFELQLLDQDGQGINLGDFRVTFDIEWFDTSSEASVGTFKIYNLSQDTASKIAGKAFSKIRVLAGYEGMEPVVSAEQVGKATAVDPSQDGQRDGQNYGLIFTGDIRYTMTGKDNPVDSYVLIQAADSDLAFSTTMSGTTLAAGWTADTMYRALMKDFNANGVTEGRKPENMPPTVFPRGRVLFGMTRHLMDNVADQCRARWQLVDGKMEMMAQDDITHEAIDLNSHTGLIGMPQQTLGNNVNVRCLINPNIKLKGLIRLNQGEVLINHVALPSSDISKAQQRYFEDDLNGNASVALPENNQHTASIATDGVYIVRGIMYTGDTRGQAWYMDMMCEARGAQNIGSQASYDRGFN